MTQHFPFGTWNYPSIKQKGAEEVERWVRCGMTLTQSFRFSYGADDKSRMLALLDECEKAGIRLIVCIDGLDFRAFTNEEDYRKTFARAYEDFGRHPAAYGFHIGDEPMGKEELAACITIHRIQKEIAPELTPFLNLYPYHAGYEDNILGGRECIEWAKEFTAAADCHLLSYDCYTQMLSESWGVDLYFRNLRIYMDMAKATDSELWTTLLSVAHFHYRAPSEDDFRWQVSTAAASGCRSILWFYFYGGIPSDSYRKFPVDEFNEETETFRDLARVQKRFHAMYGDLLMTLKHRATYHIGQSFGEYPLFPENTHPLIKRVESPDNIPGILSFFEDKDGREYCILVNNSPDKPNRLNAVLDKKVEKILRIELNGERITDFAKNHYDCEYKENEDEVTAGVWYAPGQMEMFRFE